MINNIKLFFLFLLTSCSISQKIDYGYFEYVDDFLFREKVNISQNDYASAIYSFIKVSYKRNEATFVLSEVDNEKNTFTWIGSNLEKIITWNGIIIETSGFSFDFSINNLRDSIKKDLYLLEDEIYSLDLEDPLANNLAFQFIFEGTSKHQFKPEGFDAVLNVTRINFLKKASFIGWSSKNYILFSDQSRLPVYSEQFIHPHHPKLKISYYFK